MKKVAFLLLLVVGLSSGCGTAAKLGISNDVIISTLANAFIKKDLSALTPLLSSNFSLGNLTGAQAISTASSVLTNSSGSITDVLLKSVEKKGAETLLNTVMKVDGKEEASTVKLDNGGKISSISYLTDLFTKSSN